MKKILLAFVCTVYLHSANAQTPVLVKNINPQDEGTGLSNELAYLGTDYVFVSQKKLWKTDGTTAGTVVIKDFAVENISSLSRLTTFGAIVMFAAGGATNQLWKTDGTIAGTMLVKDFGTYTVMFRRAVVGNTLLFGAGDNINGNELWKTDGTVAGTVLVKDIAPGTASGNPTSFQNLGGTLLFCASTTLTGTSLWKSDGTAAGTTVIKDLDASSTSFGNSGEMTVVNSYVIFYFEQVATGREAWVSDGTDAGTFLLKDIGTGTTGSFPDQFTVINNQVYFAAQDASTMQLWKTDGTIAGTVPFFDLVPSSKNDRYGYLTNCNGTLYFSASANYVLLSAEPYTSDGTPAGTTLLKDIVPGTNGSDARGFQYLGGFVYFIANTAATGYELWKTDGTGANTAMVTEILPGSAAGIGGTYTINGIVNNKLLFSGVDSIHNAEPFISDGTAAGTMLLKNIQTRGLGGYPTYITPIGNRFYFSGTTGFSNIEPWYSDGTEAGTQLLKDIEAGYSKPFEFTNIDNSSFYFKTYNGTLRNIYKSDGTAGGTTPIVTDVLGDPMVMINDLLFFIKRTAANGTELWKYQAGASSLVKDIYSGGLNSFPSVLTSFNNQLFFFANDGINGEELWKSDGTAVGTAMVADINPGPAGSRSSVEMIVFGGELYFFANNGTSKALMKSNGTLAGTLTIKAFTGNDDFDNFFLFGNNLFFIKKNTNPSGQVNVECWKTDGTNAGTELVKQIFPFTSGTDTDYLQAISFYKHNNLFYFYFDRENLFGESLQISLWRSDGSTAGTYELQSYLFPNNDEGIFDNDLKYIARYDNNNVLFVFPDAAHGQEIWKSDGSMTGTALAAELAPGSAGGNPSGLLNFGEAIYFSSASENDINELWKIMTPAPLPLRLLSFNAAKAGNTVHLRWYTTNEINCAHFVVQRNTNGFEFESLVSIPAINGPVENTYSSIDYSPRQGMNFYRLQMVDKDGRYTYSPVIKIEFTLNNSITIFPNPANDVIVVNGQRIFKQVQLFDLSGKKVKQFTPNAGNRYFISGLPNGLYTLRLTNADHTVQSQKLIIVK